MKRLPLLISVLVVAGCGGGGGGDVWGGYTESDAKDLMGDEEFRENICMSAPGDPATSPYCRLMPTKEQVDDTDLRKVTYKGQEAWEYRNADENFCVDVWEDPENESFGSYVGICDSD
jgi:hypothetical protein